MRGKKAKKREAQPDFKYGSVLVSRLISKVMLHGKKTLAEKTVYTAIENGAQKVKEKDPAKFLDIAIGNVRPALEIRARRVGGANYQVPMPVTPRRQDTLAIRWIVELSRKKQGKDYMTLLTNELMDAYKGEGEAIKKKLDVEKMAEANKAFAHFRW
jgi:small subunit ribosomal protein S7